MQESYQTKIHQLEDTHWWFTARRDCIVRLLASFNVEKDARLIDIGCSGGPLERTLGRLGYTNVLGIDISPESARRAVSQGSGNVVLMDGTRMDFKENSFDVLIASDVLEHIENENAAMKEWYRILKPGGRALIFVPAFKFLWSGHDDANEHYRRYTREELVEGMRRNGFVIEKTSYWNFTLFTPVVAIRSIKRLFMWRGRTNNRDELGESSRMLNRIFSGIIKGENRLISKGWSYPVGISVLAVGKKE
jgi:SAM-dependent methyltransferase